MIDFDLDTIPIGTVTHDDNVLYFHADGMSASIMYYNKKMVESMRPFYPHYVAERDGDRIIYFKDVVPTNVKIEVLFRNDTLKDTLRFYIQNFRQSFGDFIYPHDLPIAECDYSIRKRIAMATMIILSKVYVFLESLEYRYE